MATTTVNHINSELAREVEQEIAQIFASLKATSERPSRKYFNARVSFASYVATAEGISFVTRIKLKWALKHKDASTRIRKILDNTPESNFFPGVRNILNDYWETTYKN